MVCIAGSQSLSPTGSHLPYGITHCYLPPNTSESAPPPAQHSIIVCVNSFTVIRQGALHNRTFTAFSCNTQAAGSPTMSLT